MNMCCESAVGSHLMRGTRESFLRKRVSKSCLKDEQEVLREEGGGSIPNRGSGIGK